MMRRTPQSLAFLRRAARLPEARHDACMCLLYLGQDILIDSVSVPTDSSDSMAMEPALAQNTGHDLSMHAHTGGISMASRHSSTAATGIEQTDVDDRHVSGCDTASDRLNADVAHANVRTAYVHAAVQACCSVLRERQVSVLALKSACRSLASVAESELWRHNALSGSGVHAMMHILRGGADIQPCCESCKSARECKCASTLQEVADIRATCQNALEAIVNKSIPYMHADIAYVDSHQWSDTRREMNESAQAGHQREGTEASPQRSNAALPGRMRIQRHGNPEHQAPNEDSEARLPTGDVLRHAPGVSHHIRRASSSARLARKQSDVGGTRPTRPASAGAVASTTTTVGKKVVKADSVPVLGVGTGCLRTGYAAAYRQKQRDVEHAVHVEAPWVLRQTQAASAAPRIEFLHAKARQSDEKWRQMIDDVTDDSGSDGTESEQRCDENESPNVRKSSEALPYDSESESESESDSEEETAQREQRTWRLCEGASMAMPSAREVCDEDFAVDGGIGIYRHSETDSDLEMILEEPDRDDEGITGEGPPQPVHLVEPRPLPPGGGDAPPANVVGQASEGTVAGSRQGPSESQSRGTQQESDENKVVEDALSKGPASDTGAMHVLEEPECSNTEEGFDQEDATQDADAHTQAAQEFPGSHRQEVLGSVRDVPAQPRNKPATNSGERSLARSERVGQRLERWRLVWHAESCVEYAPAASLARHMHRVGIDSSCHVVDALLAVVRGGRQRDAPAQLRGLSAATPVPSGRGGSTSSKLSKQPVPSMCANLDAFAESVKRLRATGFECGVIEAVRKGGDRICSSELKVGFAFRHRVLSVLVRGRFVPRVFCVQMSTVGRRKTWREILCSVWCVCVCVCVC
jgi:hypothetical protein